jgi:phospholipase/lecithinase/hemolysin
VTPFAPTRVLAFGDETSVIDDFNNDANGRKYSVNAVQTDLVTLDCKTNPIWVQTLASVYRMVFPQCNPDAFPAPTSRIFAAAGATVADVAAQVNLYQQTGGSFAATDLVTVLVGANDILAAYAQFPGVDEATLTANLEQAGAALAAQVNAIADAGGKVLISTVPEIGLTPFGAAEKSANTDTDRAALLSRLTKRFNARLRLNITDDGTKIGLLLTDEWIRAIVGNGTTSGYLNVAAAACAVALPACTTQTLVVDPATALPASGDTWLWSDDRHLSAGGQRGLGTLEATRAAGNPF